MITGVSKGLGLSMTRKLASIGHTVIGCARSKEAIDGLRDELSTAHDFSVVDVADPAEVLNWVDAAADRAGVPDLVLNNAALINSNRELWEVCPDEFGKVIDVNIKGVFHVVRAIVPHLIKKGQGVIVNFSSGWGRSTSPKVAPYCATKWAIEGLTGSLASELPRGIAAISLNPGIIHTEMLDSCFGGDASSFIKAGDWAEIAAPFVLGLSVDDNGASISVPV